MNRINTIHPAKRIVKPHDLGIDELAGIELGADFTQIDPLAGLMPFPHMAAIAPENPRSELADMREDFPYMPISPPMQVYNVITSGVAFTPSTINIPDMCKLVRITAQSALIISFMGQAAIDVYTDNQRDVTNAGTGFLLVPGSLLSLYYCGGLKQISIVSLSVSTRFGIEFYVTDKY